MRTASLRSTRKAVRAARATRVIADHGVGCQVALRPYRTNLTPRELGGGRGGARLGRRGG